PVVLMVVVGRMRENEVWPGRADYLDESHARVVVGVDKLVRIAEPVEFGVDMRCGRPGFGFPNCGELRRRLRHTAHVAIGGNADDDLVATRPAASERARAENLNVIRVRPDGQYAPWSPRLPFAHAATPIGPRCASG